MLASHGPLLPSDKAEEQKDWRKRRDKAAGELFLAVSPEERAHFGGEQDDPVKMWKVLETAHVKRRPGARFNAYNAQQWIGEGW